LAGRYRTLPRPHCLRWRQRAADGLTATPNSGPCIVTKQLRGSRRHSDLDVPSNIWFLEPTRILTSSRSVTPIAQGSLVRQTDPPTDRPRYTRPVTIVLGVSALRASLFGSSGLAVSVDPNNVVDGSVLMNTSTRLHEIRNMGEGRRNVNIFLHNASQRAKLIRLTDADR